MEDSTRSVGIETPIILRLLSKRLNPNMFLKEKTYPNIKVRMNCFHEWTGSVASSQSVYRVGADVRILWRLPVWEDRSTWLSPTVLAVYLVGSYCRVYVVYGQELSQFLISQLSDEFERKALCFRDDMWQSVSFFCFQRTKTDLNVVSQELVYVSLPLNYSSGNCSVVKG